MVNFLEQLLEKVMGPRLEVTLDPQDVLVERRGVVWNVDGSMRSCEFCNTASGVGEEQAKLVYEDDLVVAFAPLKSAAKQHFLVVPRKHIAHVGDLFADDLNILNRMKTAGQELLKKGSANLAAEDMQFSFHVPPWNSIGKKFWVIFVFVVLPRVDGTADAGLCTASCSLYTLKLSNCPEKNIPPQTDYVVLAIHACYRAYHRSIGSSGCCGVFHGS